MKITRLTLYLLLSFVGANLVVIIGNSILQIIFSITTRPGMGGRSAESSLGTIVLFAVSGFFLGIVCIAFALGLCKKYDNAVVNFMNYGGIILSVLMFVYNWMATPGNVGPILSNATFHQPALNIAYFVGAVPSFVLMRSVEQKIENK